MSSSRCCCPRWSGSRGGAWARSSRRPSSSASCCASASTCWRRRSARCSSWGSAGRRLRRRPGWPRRSSAPAWGCSSTSCSPRPCAAGTRARWWSAWPSRRRRCWSGPPRSCPRASRAPRPPGGWRTSGGWTGRSSGPTGPSRRPPTAAGSTPARWGPPTPTRACAAAWTRWSTASSPCGRCSARSPTGCWTRTGRRRATPPSCSRRSRCCWPTSPRASAPSGLWCTPSRTSCTREPRCPWPRPWRRWARRGPGSPTCCWWTPARTRTGGCCGGPCWRRSSGCWPSSTSRSGCAAGGSGRARRPSAGGRPRPWPGCVAPAGGGAARPPRWRRRR